MVKVICENCGREIKNPVEESYLFSGNNEDYYLCLECLGLLPDDYKLKSGGQGQNQATE